MTPYTDGIEYVTGSTRRIESEKKRASTVGARVEQVSVQNGFGPTYFSTYFKIQPNRSCISTILSDIVPTIDGLTRHDESDRAIEYKKKFIYLS